MGPARRRPRENGNDLWFSHKHKAFGGNIQFLSAPDGTPLWASDVEPGPTPDITTARIHALPTLYKAAAEGLPPLADKGYIGAGIGIRFPARRPKGQSEQALHVGTRMFNTLLRHVRAFGGTDRHRAQTALAHPAVRHAQPQPYWRQRPRRPRPQRNLEVITVAKTLSGLGRADL
ncbi:transposase family protein [Kitasatospora sp. NBC_01302]|nr:transposase family protein [Kitasatospora sp. NBC_01302]